MGRDSRAATTVRRVLVSSGDVVFAAVGGGEGGGERPGDESPLRDDEPSRGAGVPGGNVRRVRAARGEREPQQGVRVRDGDGPAERPPLPGQLLSAVLAR